jgi:hypothetical protein
LLEREAQEGTEPHYPCVADDDVRDLPDAVERCSHRIRVRHIASKSSAVREAVCDTDRRIHVTIEDDHAMSILGETTRYRLAQPVPTACH